MKKNLKSKIAISLLSAFALTSFAVGVVSINGIEAKAETVYVENVGASIKLTGDSGFRFPMYLTAEAEGKTVEESYTAVIPADMLGDGVELTKDTPKATVVDTTTNWQSFTDKEKGEVTASFVYLYDIPANSYTREIAFRSYVKFTDGTEGYSEQKNRSIAMVANALDANAYDGEKKENLEKYQVEVSYGEIMSFADGVTLSKDVASVAGQAPALWANYYGAFENVAWGITVTGNVEDVNSLAYVAGNTTVEIDVSGLTAGVKSIVTTPISVLTANYQAFQTGVFQAEIADGSSTTITIDKVFALPKIVKQTESTTVNVAFEGYETVLTSVTDTYGNTASVNSNSFTASGADKYTVDCTIDGYAYTYMVDCVPQSGTNVLVNADTYRGVAQVKGVSNCEVSYTTADKYQTESGALKLTVTENAGFIDFDISSLNITDLSDYIRLDFAIKFVPADGVNTGYRTYLMPNEKWNTWHSSSQGWQAMSYNVSTFADAGYTLDSLTKFRIQITAEVQVGDAFYLGSFRLTKAEKKIGGVAVSQATTTAEYTLPTANVIDQFNNTYADSVSCKVTNGAGQELTITNGKVTLPSMGKYTLTYSAVGYSDLVCTLTYSAKSDRADMLFELDTYYGFTQLNLNTAGFTAKLSSDYTADSEYNKMIENGGDCMVIESTNTQTKECIFTLTNPNVTDISGYTSIQFKVRHLKGTSGAAAVFVYGYTLGDTPLKSDETNSHIWTSANVGWEYDIYTIPVSSLTNATAFDGLKIKFVMSDFGPTAKVCFSAVTLIK